LALEYVGLSYKDVKYAENNEDEWFKKDKLTLKSDFPNLPYIIDGETVVTESDACLVYIA